MSTRIRPATPDDAEGLVDVTHAAVEDLSGTHYSAEERAAWIDFVSADAMREGLQAADRATVVAETEEADVVGFATVHGTTVRAVYVRPDVQGGGIGAALLRAVEAEAQAEGVERLDVSASLNAVGFYAAHGYERAGESTMEVGEGREIRCVDMEKELSEESAS